MFNILNLNINKRPKNAINKIFDNKSIHFLKLKLTQKGLY